MLGRVEIGTVLPRPRVLGVEFRECEEVLRVGAHHPGGDPGAELEDLVADVPEESVRGPASDEHDGEHGDSGEVHGHGAAGTDGVGPHVQAQETEDIGANTLSRFL